MTEKQRKVTLPAEEARTMLVELMHEGYDTLCSENSDGRLTITWPASTEVGKQLESTKPKTRKLTKKEKREYDGLTEGVEQLSLSDFISY